MMKVPPRFIRSVQLIALVIIVAIGFIKIRRFLALDDCLDHGRRWDYGRDVCDDR